MTQTAMKLVKTLLLSAALLGATAPGPAQADSGFGWGLGFGLLIGAPLLASSYYYRPYYLPYGYAPYYPYGPSYEATYAPPAYVQQSPAPIQIQQAYSWYYCPSSNGYYPYVRQCPEGWQQVSPTPPGL